MTCSAVKCTCGPAGHPPVGTPAYARKRAHPDAGDTDSLLLLTRWLIGNHAFVHLRFADGEFKALIGYPGELNGNDEPMDDARLRKKLKRVLDGLAAKQISQRLLVGGDWCDPPYAEYMAKGDYYDRIPWCPSQVFVNGLWGGGTAAFLATLFDKHFHVVANEHVCKALSRACSGTLLPVSQNAAWESADDIVTRLCTVAKPGDAVVLCAGLASKLVGFHAARALPAVSFVDMGCFFDYAAGLISRGWIEEDVERLAAFKRDIMPMLGISQ